MEYMVVSSRIRLARNLAGIPFPSKCSPSLAEKVYSTAKKVSDKLFDNDFVKIGELSIVERKSLIESHLISPMLESSNHGALILNKERNISIMIMEEDHIRAQCIESGLSLKKCDASLAAFDDELSRIANVAFDYKLGYLTACPTNIGTGMRASIMLFLPALTITRAIPEVKRKVEAQGLTIRGIYGEGSEAEGSMYQISNCISLGVNEETIIEAVEDNVKAVCELERKQRAKLYSDRGIELEDKIYRALGILKSAKLLTVDELMSYIAYIKLGVNLGLFKLDTAITLDELMVLSQPYSLVKLTGCGSSALERNIARADIVKRALKIQ